MSTPQVPHQPPRSLRPMFDAAPLPTTVFGPQDITWWGTLGFMVIEGTTLAVGLSTYLYLWKNFSEWPPAPLREPGVLAPTLNLLLLLVTMLPMALAGRAAKRYDRDGSIRWLLVASLCSVGTLVLRFFEFKALNVRWDTNAYGSVVWFTLGIHTTLVITDLVECLVIAALFAFGPWEEKHFSDVDDSASYQYFLSLSYVVVFLVIFLLPRWG